MVFYVIIFLKMYRFFFKYVEKKKMFLMVFISVDWNEIGLNIVNF